ncbi:MAG: hypothetical protein ACREC5_08860, partial [Thermoplasmata archaeon]
MGRLGGRLRSLLAPRVLALGLLALLLVSAVAPASGRVATVPGALASPSSPGGTAGPTGPGSNPPCYSLAATICVSMSNTTAPSIIPLSGDFTAATEPAADQSLVLIVKSHSPLNLTSSPPSAGPASLVELNVTGTLWNGDPYYSEYSGNVWHADNDSYYWWCASGTGCRAENASFPWWYYVEFAANSAAGAPNFAAGMHVEWWLNFHTYNGSNPIDWSSPIFSFTFAGAWPYSPYPGAVEYAGAAAAAEDVTVLLDPS